MKTIKTLIPFTLALLLAGPLSSATVREQIAVKDVDMHLTDSLFVVTADIVLDSLDLRPNRQVLITPVLESGAQNSMSLPSVLVNGRNMHISYERGVLRSFPAIKGKDIARELRRQNGKRQTVQYAARVPLEPWMQEDSTHVSFRYDPCGCGIASAPEIYRVPVPAREEELQLPPELITGIGIAIPEIEEVPVEIHAGKARIQFEVDRTELHVDPYVCRNGQRIDNRDQIRMIDDSVRYALSDPNVELVGIEICGYASPESPYLHNEELANGRSKALAEYLADRYNIPREKATYSAVTENWGEFRDMVEESDEITETQRRDLLGLIDAPAETPQEYDRKEWLLKTDPKFATLYKSLILPKWFPRLRATTFALQTRLKDLSDEELGEVIRHTPEKMSLNQMYRVARQYAPASDEFNGIMLQALKQYPGEPVAVTNAAIAAMARGEHVRARALLDLLDPTEQVYRLLALMAESERDYVEAARCYGLAGDAEKAAEMRANADRQRQKEEKLNRLINE